MYRAKSNGDVAVFKCGKNIGDKTPIGYEKTDKFFVDNSGFGTDGELALTASAFLTKVKEGFYYAITEIGQFQVYISEYKKIIGSRKKLYSEMGILKSYLVQQNTRIIEYSDGKKVLRLYQTDIITWTTDGHIILNSGGYDTETTRARLNEFLPQDIRIIRKRGKTYIDQTKDNGEVLEFTDGIQL